MTAASRPDDLGSFFIVPQTANQIDAEEALQRRQTAIRQSLEQSQMVCGSLRAVACMRDDGVVSQRMLVSAAAATAVEAAGHDRHTPRSSNCSTSPGV